MSNLKCPVCNETFSEEAMDVYINSETQECHVICMGCILTKLQQIAGIDFRFNTKYARIKYEKYLEECE
jgi:hypothetical protein